MYSVAIFEMYIKITKHKGLITYFYKLIKYSKFWFSRKDLVKAVHERHLTTTPNPYHSTNVIYSLFHCFIILAVLVIADHLRVCGMDDNLNYSTIASCLSIPHAVADCWGRLTAFNQIEREMSVYPPPLSPDYESQMAYNDFTFKPVWEIF